MLGTLRHYFAIPSETYAKILLRERLAVFGSLDLPLSRITYDDMRSVLATVPSGLLSTTLFSGKKGYFRHNLDLLHGG